MRRNKLNNQSDSTIVPVLAEPPEGIQKQGHDELDRGLSTDLKVPRKEKKKASSQRKRHYLLFVFCQAILPILHAAYQCSCCLFLSPKGAEEMLRLV